ncbi:MAG: hypothetical protein Q7T51_01230 [Candidatus Moranbacteria bacterium]|nr:hypothetical protein [Candidatus Moranbacteria bacterium]
MFKNQNVFDAEEANSQRQDFNQAKDLKIEDIPIHTMAKDIEEIEHPGSKQSQPIATQSVSKNASATQNNSPFFNTTADLNQQPQLQANTSQPKTPKHSFFSSLFGSAPKNPTTQKIVVQKAAEAENLATQKIAEQKVIEQRTAEIKKAAEMERVEAEKLAAQKKSTQGIEEQKAVEIRRPLPELNKALPQKKPTKMLAFIVITFIALIIGIGVYYLLLLRQDVIIVEPTIEPETVTIPEPEVIIVPELSFSNDKPNYLSIDTTAIDNTQIKEAINKFAEDIKKSAVTTPIEFIVTDTQNNPIDFATFSQKMGLTLSKNILTYLNKNFSLFIFNDNGNMRLGLTVDFANSAKLKPVLLKEEPILAKNISALLLSTIYELPTAVFGKSIYNGIDIRYQNIVSPENLSIDYALTDKQLVIGTTKMTLRSIIDKIAPATTTIQPKTSATSAMAPTTTGNTEQPVDNLLNKE